MVADKFYGPVIEPGYMSIHAEAGQFFDMLNYF